MLHNYLFIDECGDPEFYGKRKKLLVGEPGYQPLLILGLVETTDRKSLKQAVLAFQQQILADSLYRSIYSVQKSGWFLHARADHPEIRGEFFKFLRSYPDIRFHAVIARKDLSIFNRKHNSNPSEFYFDIVHHLLNGRFQFDYSYNIYLAQKQKNSQDRFVKAVDQTIVADIQQEKLQGAPNYRCSIVPSSEMPELSVVDYFLWALQRYIYQNEIRFWESVEHKVVSVLDLYDHQNLAGNIYSGIEKPFRLEKASPFLGQ
ncbi:DUF3800 domain-containing protein [Spirosoma foliorum]|uniref:DUF3800 domain-containing protein n=1 Tax=Spirosoma foliorum TaxID=2710596 RepID=A0A7G5H5A6_9BACT|nr:DUF3800 domain-containing protein [Spirosoma foliorum]